MNNRWRIAQEHERDIWSKATKSSLKASQQRYSEFMKKIKKELRIKNKTKVLDIGCGPLPVSELLPSKNYGIDPLLLDYLRQKTAIESKVVCAVGEKIPFKNSCFDVVMCMNAIDHTKNPVDVVEEAKRVVKRNGFVLFSSSVFAPQVKKIKTFFEVHSIPGREVYHPHFFSQRDFEKLFSSFKIVRKEFVFDPIERSRKEKTMGQKISYSIRTNGILGFVSDVYFMLLWKFFYIINKHVFRNSWYVKEYAIVARK